MMAYLALPKRVMISGIFVQRLVQSTMILEIGLGIAHKTSHTDVPRPENGILVNAAEPVTVRKRLYRSSEDNRGRWLQPIMYWQCRLLRHMFLNRFGRL